VSSYIHGVGTTSFGKQPDRSAIELGWEAVDRALRDANLEPKEVDAVFAATVFGETGTAQRILKGLALAGLPVVTIENACASGTSAFHEARVAVESGRFDTVLALGFETMTARFDTAIEPSGSDAEGRQAFGMPAIYGMSAARYQHEFGLTSRQLALVSVKNHRHGLLNPLAQHKRAVSVEEVLSSRMISDPLTLLQCCSLADAASAAIVGVDRRCARDIRIRSSALNSGAIWGSGNQKVWGWDIVHDTACIAYEQANLGPDEIDLLEVHDAFTIGEIVTTEALGLCGLGDGGRLVELGHTELGGRQPVNPSGGLLARGHPLGATGLAQIAEIVCQLRGEALERQVPDARIGLVETMGGGTAGIDGNACVVTVLGN